MPLELPSPVASYLAAEKAKDADKLALRFADDALVHGGTIPTPALRDHRQDIPAMAREFAHRYGQRFGNPAVRLSPALLDALAEADWPGNVRELENTIARMVVVSGSREIDLDALRADSHSPKAWPKGRDRRSLCRCAISLRRMNGGSSPGR